MPIVQRGQSFQVTVNASGKRYRRQFPSHLEAQQWELEAKIAITKGQVPDLGDAASTRAGEYRANTVGQLMDYLITHKWTGTKGEKAAIINARHIVRIVGPDTALKAVSTHTINLAVAQLKADGYPLVTINKKLSPLRVALKHALDERWIDHLPKMPFYKPGEGRIRVFTYAEEKAMRDWCVARGQSDLLDYIVVSYHTGMRQGEVLTLKPRNLQGDCVTLWGARTDVDNGTKAATTRTIPLTGEAQTILDRRCPEGAGLLFAMGKDQITRSWNAMRDALGFKDDPEYVPHAMRHTFCSRLVNDHDRNLIIVQRLAGHLRLETTAKYVHLDHDALVRAIAALAPRRDSVYTPAPHAGTDMPHANVASHNAPVPLSNGPETAGNVLIMQRNIAAV